MKKITSFFTMLSIALSGVAQETTPNPETDYGTRLTPAQFNEITTPTKIAIECTQIDNYGHFYNGSGKSATLTENSIYVLEPVVENTAGLYYIKRENGTGENVYWSSSSPSNNACVSKANAQKFKATSVSTMADTKYADFATYGIRITFEDGSKWLRLSAAHDFAANSATGVWTMQNVYKVSKVTIKEIKDEVPTTNVHYCLSSSSKSYDIPQHVGYTYTVEAEGVAEDATSFTATNASDVTVTVTYTYNAEKHLAAVTEGIKAGTKVGEYTQTSIDTWKAKVAAVEEKIEAGTATKADVESIEAAIADLEINMPDPAKTYVIENAMSAGNKYAAGSYIYADNGKLVHSNALRNASMFKFEAGTDANTFLLYNVETKTYLNSAKAHEGGQATLGETDAKALSIALMDANYSRVVSITPVGGGMLHAANTKQVVAWDNTEATSASAWVIKEVSEVSFPLKVGSTCYATLMLGFDAEIPENVTCYTAVNEGNVAKLTAVEGVLPAGTAVVVKATAPETTYDFKVATEEAANVGKNDLVGTLENKNIEEDAYVLAHVEGVTAFYKAEKNISTNKENDGEEGTEDDTYEAFMNNAYKAYLPAAAVESGARVILFDFGTETAIESIQGAESASAVVYDLAGRRVKGAQKGLYIVNGKVVIK